MDFDWLDVSFDLRKITPKEIEESFEDPFSIRLLPEGSKPTRRPAFSTSATRSGTRAFSPSSGPTERISRYLLA
jgi:hypothetical protein